jgi:hypothetical protein
MNIRPLICLDVKSAEDIFRETFHFEEHKEFSPIWRDRTREESVGVFNDDGDLLGFILIFSKPALLQIYCGSSRNIRSLELARASQICSQEGSLKRAKPQSSSSK